MTSLACNSRLCYLMSARGDAEWSLFRARRHRGPKHSIAAYSLRDQREALIRTLAGELPLLFMDDVDFVSERSACRAVMCTYVPTRSRTWVVAATTRRPNH